MEADRLAPYVANLAAQWRDPQRQRWVEVEATMMFADLSGFTRLSERVARVPGAGAEVVKRTINAVFEPCVGAVLAEAGDIVKFAGDGLMMMFSDDDHPRRAARAALAIQAAVAAIRRVDTPAGPARIGVSIGAETGPVTCLLTHADRLELVVTGPAVDEMFALEALAASGQTVIGPRLAAALPRDAVRRIRRSDHRQLRPAAGSPAASPSSAPVPDRPAPSNEPAAFLAPEVRTEIEGGPIPAEHRSAAIAFVALGGLSAVHAEGGPGGLLAHLDRFTATVADACRATEVCWLESDSDRDQVRVLLSAGAPRRSDIDEQRMLDAVWRIVTECAGLPVRAGVSRGRVFVGDVGHPLRRTYNVMGDAVNVAARLAGKAATGEVLALDSVVHAKGSMARVEERPPLAVKGKRVPLDVYRVTGLSPATEQASIRPPTIGRQRELAQLRELSEAARRGHGCVVTIRGEAGVGKSHVARQLADEWPGPVAICRGLQFERSTPFGSIAHLLRSLFGIDPAAEPDAAGRALRSIVDATAPDLAERVPLIADGLRADVESTVVVDAIRPEFRQEQILAATVALARSRGATPTMFLIEDADAMDASSTAMLRAIAAAAAGEPWLVVVTQRPTGHAAVESETIDLAPLDPAAIRDVVVDAAGDAAIGHGVIDRIVRQSAGNPMFARELTLGWLAGATDIHLPDAIERAVASRLDNLPIVARTLVRDLAVGGTAIESSLARDVLGDRLDDEVVWDLVAQYVARVGGSIRFERDIYQVAAYAGLAHQRRETVHRQFARALAATRYAAFEAARIAEHAHAGADHELAWQWARAAARAAAATGASEEEARHWSFALAAAEHQPAVDRAELIEVAEHLGAAFERSGDVERAHAAFRQARQLLGPESPEHARLFRKHASVAERSGAFGASLRWCTRGLRLLPDDGGLESLGERAELELRAAVVRFFQGKIEVATTLAERAAQHAEEAGAMRTLAQAHLQLEMCCSERGLPERSVHGLRALELFEMLDDGLGLANLRLNLGVSAYNDGRWDEALHHYRRSVAEYQRVGDAIGADSTKNNGAEILTDQGRGDEAVALLREARRGMKAANFRLGVAITASGLGRLATRAGAFDEAERRLAEARAEFVELDSGHLIADTDVRLVELDVWRGRFTEALARCTDVDRQLAAIGAVPVLPASLERLRAFAVAGSGEGDPVAHLEQALATARSDQFPYEVALSLDALLTVAGDGPTGREQRAAWLRERDVILRRLGVVAAPRPPWLAAAAAGSGREVGVAPAPGT